MRIANVILLLFYVNVSLGYELNQDQRILPIDGDSSLYESKLTFEAKHPKLVAVIITIALGPLGGHRLYLRTKPIVPIVYALTLGGGLGLLPIIDLIVITFTKDLDKYRGNNKIIMWL